MNPKWDVWMKGFAWTDSDIDTDFEGARYCLQKCQGTGNSGTELSLTALLAFVFRKWSSDLTVERLCGLLEGLHPQGRAVLLSALQCAPEEAREVLSLLESEDATLLSAIQNAALIKRPSYFENPESVEVLQSYHLDLCWGLYFGSGDRRFLQKIVERAAWLHTPPGRGRQRRTNLAVGHAAVWSTSSLSNIPHIEEDLVAIFDAEAPVKEAFDRALAEYARRESRRGPREISWGEA